MGCIKRVFVFLVILGVVQSVLSVSSPAKTRIDCRKLKLDGSFIWQSQQGKIRQLRFERVSKKSAVYYVTVLRNMQKTGSRIWKMEGSIYRGKVLPGGPGLGQILNAPNGHCHFKLFNVTRRGEEVYKFRAQDVLSKNYPEWTLRALQPTGNNRDPRLTLKLKRILAAEQSVKNRVSPVRPIDTRF